MAESTDDPRYPWLEKQVSAGATIVTASRRLARDLVETYSARKITAGQAAWQTPPILYWPDWLSRTFMSVEDPSQAPRRLDPLSASILWERCLKGRVSEAVLSIGSVVRQSVQAWQRLGEWNVPVQAVVAAASTEDERLFAAAAADYLARLQENNWIDSAGMTAFVAGVLAVEPTLVPKRLAMAGFDRRSPSITQVVEVLEANGCAVIDMPAAERTGGIDVVSYADTGAELRA
ncbi:MAG: hypothetical protein OEM63_13700, partial [Gammaproteobacteria bacterium]|nr:hypothetical protein [Gammaproteobacteria bacterium]